MDRHLSRRLRLNGGPAARRIRDGDLDVSGSSRSASNGSDPTVNQPRYGVLNARIGVTVRKWVFSLNGRNLTNNKTITQRPSIYFVEEGYLLRPFTVGVRASLHF